MSHDDTTTLEERLSRYAELCKAYDGEAADWDSMPAVGRERFWLPAANRYPFKTLMELKRMRHGCDRLAKGSRAAKQAQIKAYLRRCSMGSVHITPAGGNLFATLGFPPGEAAALKTASDRAIRERRGSVGNEPQGQPLDPEDDLSIQPSSRRIKTLPNLAIPADFDGPLPSEVLDAFEGSESLDHLQEDMAKRD